jgi:hypothetical protein
MLDVSGKGAEAEPCLAFNAYLVSC